MIKELYRNVSNLIKLRRRVMTEDVDISKFCKVVEDAKFDGVETFAISKMLGGRVLRDNRATADQIKSTLEGFFVPHEKFIGEEWIYRTEFKGKHEVFSGPLGEVHYLDARDILFGGAHRSSDEGRKPHLHYWMSVRYNSPKSK